MYKLKTLFVVSFSASLLMSGVGMIVALLPEKILTLSASVQDVGFLASIFAISYLLAQLPVGYMADKLSAKPFLVFGYFIVACSGVAFYFSESTKAIFVGRFIQGLGEAPIWALGPAILSLAYPKAKGKVIGIYNASIHIGLSVGPIIGIYFFLNENNGEPFLLFSGLCLLGGILVLIFLPKMSQGVNLGKIPNVSEFISLLKSREPMITLLGILIFGAGYGVCISVLPATLSLDKGFGNVENGLFFTAFYVSISIAQVVIGPLSDKHGRIMYMVFGLVLSAIGFVSFSFFAYPWIFIPLIVASIGLGIFSVSSMAYLYECAPETFKSSISASYCFAWGGGYFLGPMVIGKLSSEGYPFIGYVLLASALLVEAFAIKSRLGNSIR